MAKYLGVGQNMERIGEKKSLKCASGVDNVYVTPQHYLWKRGLKLWIATYSKLFGREFGRPDECGKNCRIKQPQPCMQK
jgi:hypothetical protein